MNGINASTPSRKMTACALFFDENREILLVKPADPGEEDWHIGAGGKIDRDESPFQACQREVREELGAALPVQQILCIEYQSPQERRGESLHFTFHGGVLSPAQIRQIQLPAEELLEFRFCAFGEAIKLLSPRLSKRLVFALTALEQKRVIYLEDLKELC